MHIINNSLTKKIKLFSICHTLMLKCKKIKMVYSQQSFFFRLLVLSDWRLHLVRHALLWTTTILLIFQGFYFVSNSMPVYTPSNAIRYSLSATGLFGSLTIVAYVAITYLTKRFILNSFRLEYFLLGFLFIHVVTSEIVMIHFKIFTDLYSLNELPKIYKNYGSYVVGLPFWKVPFDPIVVWLFSFSLFYNYLLYAVGLKIFKDFFTIQHKQIELEKENIKLEFEFLKSQISPHFLFNTLNNIYSFVINSPSKAADTILKLADLMRYMLYETSEEWVNLSKEVAFLESYITLQRIRHDKHVAIRFRVTGQPTTQLIPPLLLVIFVENAFKHGIQASVKDSWVDIHLQINSELITLNVDNSVPVNSPVATGGIGLRNAQKRLFFLYSNNFKLSVLPELDHFSVKLILPSYGSRL